MVRLGGALERVQIYVSGQGPKIRLFGTVVLFYNPVGQHL